MKITADYSDGVLTNLVSETIPLSEMEPVENTAERKIFYWDSLESMTPVYKSK